MPYYALDAILLVVFSLPIVLRYKILPTETTPYWLFGILFLIMMINILLSVYPTFLGRHNTFFRVKSILLGIVLCIVLGGVVGTSIIDRSKGSPTLGVHDIILQQEAAMRYLLVGKNPYKETYFGTPVEQFHYDEVSKDDVNPALYHFVMPPWYLLFPLSFYVVSIPVFGFFDGRFALLFSMLLLVIFLYRWFKNTQIATLAVIFMALSPATVDYFIEGRSDIFALSWLVASLFFLERKRLFWSSIFFALSILSKQTMWFAVPFYFFYVWLVNKRNFQKVLKPAIVVSIICAIFTGPFLAWDYRAFFNSVILYLSGGTTTSYPVSGYGFSMVLHQLGVVSDRHQFYPFLLWQLVVGLPVLVISLFWLSKKLSMSRLLIGYGVTLSVIWYFSRYFNNSHLAYLSSIFVIGVLKDMDEKSP